MTSREYAIQCIKDEAEALLELIPQLDDQFDKAVEINICCISLSHRGVYCKS